MTSRVVVHRGAWRDLVEFYSYIRDRSGPRTAGGYVERIRLYCEGFARFPKRGAIRPGLGTGVRVVGFEGRVSIAFVVEPGRVIILGIYYAGEPFDLDGVVNRYTPTPHPRHRPVMPAG